MILVCLAVPKEFGLPATSCEKFFADRPPPDCSLSESSSSVKQGGFLEELLVSSSSVKQGGSLKELLQATDLDIGAQQIHLSFLPWASQFVMHSDALWHQKLLIDPPSEEAVACIGILPMLNLIPTRKKSTGFLSTAHRTGLCYCVSTFHAKKLRIHQGTGRRSLGIADPRPFQSLNLSHVLLGPPTSSIHELGTLLASISVSRGSEAFVSIRLPSAPDICNGPTSGHLLPSSDGCTSLCTEFDCMLWPVSLGNLWPSCWDPGRLT
nr:hypothetical protein Iba_chr03cCG7890 [Ipomoea batatas]